ncbi:histidine phosphatase family protein [Mordavella massiliensis]|uniref:Histidine phosphatase family protein n=1 Tax=Mordavella massiliensis TaxID=1871024 RepID=A0A939BG77_9CLOT|nr:histidine phosphatase family protein [Mordavella massiliensis]MBM6947604.1 histidine phosphatase family protein [Mordavella massiliensis]
MKIYIVRHGQTDWNKARRIQGQVDIPLNEFGRHLARETARGLRDVRFDACFTSPLSRAKETAQIILAGRDVPVIDEPRLEEMSFGVYEGKCCAGDNWELPENFHRFFDGPDRYEAPEGGESFGQVRDRTGAFLEELARRPEYADGQILLATHGAALAGLLCYIRRAPLADYWGVGVHKNCAVTEVEAKDGSFRILSENVVYYKDKVDPWAK